MILDSYVYPYYAWCALVYRKESSLDSSLEAFSYNPADVGFSSLSVRVNENTNYLNQLFLSYWVELLLQR
jgi:hypothetical protein